MKQILLLTFLTFLIANVYTQPYIRTMTNDWGINSRPTSISGMKVMPNGDYYLAVYPRPGFEYDFEPETAGKQSTIPIYNLCKYTSTPTGPDFQWGKFIACPEIVDIDVDPTGTYIYAVGSYGSASADFDPGPGVFNLPYTVEDEYNGYVAKYRTSDGGFVDAWAIQSNRFDRVTRVKISQGGDIFISGYFDKPQLEGGGLSSMGDYDDPAINYVPDLDRRLSHVYTPSGTCKSFVIRYASNGTFNYFHEVPEPVSDIEFDGTGNAIIMFRGVADPCSPAPGYNPETTYLRKVDFYGNTIASIDLSAIFGGKCVVRNSESNAYHEYTSIDKDGEGNFYALITMDHGAFAHPGQNKVIKFDPNLNILWGKNIGAGPTDATWTMSMGSIQYDGGCRIYLSVYNEGSYDMNPDAGTNNVSGNGLVLLSLSTNIGAIQTLDYFVGAASGVGNSTSSSVQYDANGKAYLLLQTGTSGKDLDFDQTLGTRKFANTDVGAASQGNIIARMSIPTAARNPNISGPTIICPGDNATITATGGGAYTWNTGAATAAITVSPPVTTTYEVTIDVGGGCPVGSVKYKHTVYVDCILLPVTMVSFEGENISLMSNKLFWKTEVESGNFILERSYNHGKQLKWSEIGFIDRLSTNRFDYSFIDNRIDSDSIEIYGNTVYYRLSEVNESGNKKEAGITAVEMNSISDFEIYPNPSTEYIMVDISTDQSSLSIYNYLGQRIYFIDKLSKGKHRIEEKFSSGVYKVQLNTENNHTVMYKSFVRL